MASMLQNNMAQAIPVIERNTFLTVYSESEAPPRRCSSVPARLRPCVDEFECLKDSSFDGCDSETVTDVCTEASDEPTSSSDSATTSEYGAEAPYPLAFGDFSPEELSPCPPPPTPLRTALRAKAAHWEPSAPVAPKAPLMWRVGAADSPEWLQWWKDTAADMVAKMSCVLGKSPFISQVDCKKEGEDWVVSARCNAAGMWQFQQLQTVAKESLLQAAEESECMYLLGHKRMPFQPSQAGFFASLGSMGNTKKACWDVYNKGVCPRGSECLWEHPAFVTTVNVKFDFGDCTFCWVSVGQENN